MPSISNSNNFNFIKEKVKQENIPQTDDNRFVCYWKIKQ